MPKDYNAPLIIDATSPHFIVPTNRQLADRRFYRQQIWEPARREAQDIGGRRKWKGALTDLYLYQGCFFYLDGTPYDVPAVDDVFLDDEMKCVSNFLRESATPGRPWSYTRELERLRMIYLYCQIRAFEASGGHRPMWR